MKLFLPLPGLRSKTYFKKCFSFDPRRFKIDFKNRKPIYPKQQSFFDNFQLYLCSSLATIKTTMIQEVKTGNGIISTDNVVISPTSRPFKRMELFFLLPDL